MSLVNIHSWIKQNCRDLVIVFEITQDIVGVVSGVFLCSVRNRAGREVLDVYQDAAPHQQHKSAVTYLRVLLRTHSVRSSLEEDVNSLLLRAYGVCHRLVSQYNRVDGYRNLVRSQVRLSSILFKHEKVIINSGIACSA